MKRPFFIFMELKQVNKMKLANNDNTVSMAESVTRHTLISSEDKIEYLTCGVDTLDVGFYVTWGDDWEELRQKFDDRKSYAQGTDGYLIDVAGVRPHNFYASGKAPNYRYHVKFPEYHGVNRHAIMTHQ